MNRPKNFATIMIVGSIMWIARPASAQTPVVWYVDAEAPGGNGQSWGTAFNSLQVAVQYSVPNQSPPQQIWVKRGVYGPGLNRADAFALKPTVKVFGALAGTENPGYPQYFDPEADGSRDFVANETILNGDIGEPGVATDNSYAIVSIAASGVPPCRLDGFTIRDGYGNNGSGGGIIIYGGASPTLANLRIMNNYAPGFGGGVYVAEGAPTFTGCRFEGNRSGYGAALFLESGAGQLRLDRCMFSVNIADQQAAGICNWRPAALRVEHTVFLGNHCLGTSQGSVITNEAGSNAAFTNCLVHGNTGVAGAMLNTSNSTLTLVNSTVSYNTANCGTCGGLYTEGAATVANSVFWGNTAPEAQDETAQLEKSSSATLAMRYTSLQDWSTYSGTGNNGDDPWFVDPPGADHIVGTPDDNLRVRRDPNLARSIDSANNADVPTPQNQQTDLDGHLRIIEGDGAGDPIVDRGAYEYDPSIDCNGNSVPDSADIASGYSQDCNGNSIPDECDIAGAFSQDCNSNGIPDECDWRTGVLHDCNADGEAEECAASVGYRDCNQNCIIDSLDISNETSLDENNDGIPDECQYVPPGMWSYADSFAAHAGDHAKPINVHAEPDGCDYPGVLRRNPVQAYQCTTQGELIRGTSPLPYLWVAASGRGTVVRINTDTGVIEGEYRTGATRHLTSSCGQEGAA